jgi:hypothetical protein
MYVVVYILYYVNQNADIEIRVRFIHKDGGNSIILSVKSDMGFRTTSWHLLATSSPLKMDFLCVDRSIHQWRIMSVPALSRHSCTASANEKFSVGNLRLNNWIY